MTITPQVTEASYALNGANLGPFATSWGYEADTDVYVAVDLGNGYEVLTSGQTYTLTDSAGGTETNGGTVTLSNTLLVNGAWPANSVLYLWRSVAGGQPSAFGEMGAFSPSTNEDALDHLARQVEELRTFSQRTIAGRPAEQLSPLPSASERALGVFAFDQNGQPMVLAGSTALAQPSGATLDIPNVTYSPDNSVAPQTFVLGLLSGFGEGMFVEVYDAMNNAANKTITVEASVGDEIYDHGATSAAYVISNSNTITRFTKRNGMWRVMEYGG